MNGWDVEEFELLPDFLSLTPNDQAYLRQSYLAANPLVFQTLLASAAHTSNSVKMDEYHFSNDKGSIFAGLVEILYSMRNLLFHGEVVPDRQTNRTYEPAYHILRQLLEYIV